MPARTSVRVPILTLASSSEALGSVFVWLQSRPGDRLRIGFDAGLGGSTRWVESGDSRAFAVADSEGDFDVTVVNDPSEPDAGLGVGSGSAAVVISADRSIDYRVIQHVTFTAAQVGYGNIHLAVSER